MASLPAPHEAHPLQHTDLDLTLLTIKVPPGAGLRLEPRVEHLAVRETTAACDFISASLGLPGWFVAELMRFGAVYWCPVHPVPPARARTPASLETASECRSMAMARHGRSPALQHPRRLLVDRLLDPGAYLRVHVHPQRFPAFHGADWTGRLLHNGDGFIVANKPAGVQVVPRVDNRLECLMYWAAGRLGLEEGGLLPVHRLDLGTEGLVVMARSEATARHLCGVMRDRAHVRKCYRALSAAAPEVGTMVHSLEVGRREEGEPAHTVACDPTNPRAARCELEVLSVREVALGDAGVVSGRAFESMIALKTGKTHQIRAQLAAAGCPIVGDTLYAAVAKKYGYQGVGREGEAGPSREGREKIGPEEARCDRIGLQAFRLEFLDADWEDVY
eukprot:evm.model.scf_2596.4 EVM.evm.TU.scf_2596.4   scf_2596:15058-16225(+)